MAVLAGAVFQQPSPGHALARHLAPILLTSSVCLPGSGRKGGVPSALRQPHRAGRGPMECEASPGPSSVATRQTATRAPCGISAPISGPERSCRRCLGARRAPASQRTPAGAHARAHPSLVSAFPSGRAIACPRRSRPSPGSLPCWCPEPVSRIRPAPWSRRPGGPARAGTDRRHRHGANAHAPAQRHRPGHLLQRQRGHRHGQPGHARA